MKNLYTLLAFIIFAGLTALSQGKVDYDSRSRFYLGLNFGGTYHSNTEVDVNNMYRAGAGFTFGYSFGMKPQNLFSLDLQLRYLHAAYRGLSESNYILDSTTTSGLDLNSSDIEPSLALSTYENTYGYYVPNFRSIVNDWSLELKLNTNRWRENTGWNFFVLGGIGTSRYITTTDLYDNNSANVLQIKPEADLSEKGVFISDYETELVDNRDWMPSFGMGIEKQITPNAAFQVMGRMTWTRNNDFDGLVNNFSGQNSGINDRYHYASAGIKFYLRGHDNKYVDEDDDPIVRPNTPVTGQKPAARFTMPNRTPITVSVNRYSVMALVQNVAGKQNITFTHNGQILDSYTYNANTDKLNYSANLIQGQNTFTVTAINDFGRAEDRTIIIYNPQVTVNPPQVTFVNPSRANTTVNIASYNLTATVLNVDSKQNTSLFVNGVSYNNYNFNASSNQLTSVLSLVPGKNVVTVTGTNTVGTDSESTFIIYREVVTGNPPEVSIVVPALNPFQTNINTANVTATVLNVTARNNITVSINGSVINNFNYSNNRVTLTTNLIIGNNIVSIRGTNQFGQDEAQTTIIYNPVNNIQPPIVNIFSPNNGSIVRVPQANIVGQVEHVSSKNNIQVRINGQATNNFSFNNNTKAVNFVAGLIPGNNSIQIIGSNADGQDQETINLVYDKPIVRNPPIVNIIDPNINNKVYRVSNINARATLLNVASSNDIVVTLNGTRIYNFSFNSNTKLLSVPLSLSVGNNTLIVTGNNSDGTDSDQKTMRYKKAVSINPPTVNFTNPSITPVTVNNASFTLSALTTNVTGKNQIILKQNGNVVNSSNYTFSSSTISYPTALVLGNNTFEVTVSNAAGTDNATTVIVYKKEVIPCTKPTIGYVAPAPNNIVNAANNNIEAQINNHVPGTQVTLKLNGTSVGSMTYNASTQIANKSVTLNQGVNTLEITVSNSCGTNKSTFILNYKNTSPCNSPVIAITSSTAQTQTNPYLFKASLSHITSGNQLSLKLNGINTTFQLVGSSLAASLNLVSGNNSISLEANNNCGNDKKTIVVNHNPCTPPKVTITSSTNAITTTNYNLNANLTGVSGANQVTLFLNGLKKTFSLNNGILNAALTLRKGTNTIKIVVSNSCGTDTQTISIVSNTCESPKLVMVTPSTASVTTKTSVYNLSLKVNGDITQSGILVKQNGIVIPFTYSSATKMISISTKNLRNGKNTINVSASSSCGSDALNYTINYASCIVPKINAFGVSNKITTVKTLNYKYSGTVSGMTSKTGIQLKLNGKSVAFSYNVATGRVTAELRLREGMNSISLTASNACGRDSQSSSVNADICETPTLRSLTPVASAIDKDFQQISIAVTGATNANQISVKVNGRSIPKQFANNKISFTASGLIVGNNVVSVVVNTNCGSDQLTLNIRRKACNKPIINQKTTATKVTSLSFPYSATINGVSTKSGIVLKVNNKAVTFNFSASSGLLTSTINLKEGNNTIQLTATNNCGSITKTHSVNATTCQKPDIKLGYPTNPNITTANSTFSLLAIGVNVVKSDITVTNNGKSIPFNFDASKGKITVQVSNMTSGMNKIKIKATKSCGSSEVTYNINYTGGNTRENIRGGETPAGNKSGTNIRRN